MCLFDDSQEWCFLVLTIVLPVKFVDFAGMFVENFIWVVVKIMVPFGVLFGVP